MRVRGVSLPLREPLGKDIFRGMSGETNNPEAASGAVRVDADVAVANAAAVVAAQATADLLDDQAMSSFDPVVSVARAIVVVVFTASVVEIGRAQV